MGFNIKFSFLIVNLHFKYQYSCSLIFTFYFDLNLVHVVQVHTPYMFNESLPSVDLNQIFRAISFVSDFQGVLTIVCIFLFSLYY